MSDPFGEFDFDEDGIYREKDNLQPPRDAGIMVDEDGIWRDDLDSLYTDSGFGTRRTSELNRLHSDIDRDFNVLYDEYRGRQSVDQKSVNISEFEASESNAGEDYSFEDRSLGSEDRIEFPELNEDNYMNEQDDRLGFLLPQPHFNRQNFPMDIPEVTGDSIFTQQEDTNVTHQGQSLAEFERLEAQINEGSGDNIDLIGAYLQDLKEKERDDTGSEKQEKKKETEVASGPLEDSLIENTVAPFDSINFSSFEFGDKSEGKESESTARAVSPTRSTCSKSPTRSSRCPSPATKRMQSPTRALKAFPLPKSSESPRQTDKKIGHLSPRMKTRRSKSQLHLSDAGDADLIPPRPSSAGIPLSLSHNIYADPNLAQLNMSQLDISELRTSIEDSDLSNSEKARELKVLFLQEVQQRKLNDETYKQLQIEYNSLLKKYAEAENTIDELRLGAKITLYSDSPVPQAAIQGSTPAAQHAQVFQMGKPSIASVGNVGKASTASTVQASRPPSCTSITSGSVFTGNIESSIPEQNVESASIVEDGIKLAVITKSKAVEEQIDAFQILLSEKHLSLEDQEQALNNIKKSFQELQQQYKDAKDDHDFMRRQGLTPGGASESSVAGGFDENKEVEGAIYKLSMKLDDVDHRVQENLKERTKRRPFQGGPQPMRGDHSISVAQNASSMAEQKHKRPSSVDSITPEIDQKMQKLLKDYDHFLEHYEQLKQMRRTPMRDEEINNLVHKLKSIYDQTPDHSKPTLPEDLKSRILGSRQPSLASPASHRTSLSRRSSPGRSRSSDGSRRSSPSRIEASRRSDFNDGPSDLENSLMDKGSRSSGNRSRMSRDDRSSDYTSGMSRPSNDLKRYSKSPGRRELPDTRPLDKKDTPAQGRGRGRRLPVVSHRLREERANAGSEHSSGPRSRQGHRSRQGNRSDRRALSHNRDFVRTDARSPLQGDYSHSDSDSSADSVVERRIGGRRSESNGHHRRRNSLDQLSDGRRRRGQAMYGSLSESDSDISDVENYPPSREHAYQKRVHVAPLSYGQMAGPPVTGYGDRKKNRERSLSPEIRRKDRQKERHRRPLSPPQYEQVYRNAKMKANKGKDYVDEPQYVVVPAVDSYINTVPLQRYQSTPNLHDYNSNINYNRDQGPTKKQTDFTEEYTPVYDNFVAVQQPLHQMQPTYIAVNPTQPHVQPSSYTQGYTCMQPYEATDSYPQQYVANNSYSQVLNDGYTEQPVPVQNLVENGYQPTTHPVQGYNMNGYTATHQQPTATNTGYAQVIHQNNSAYDQAVPMHNGSYVQPVSTTAVPVNANHIQPANSPQQPSSNAIVYTPTNNIQRPTVQFAQYPHHKPPLPKVRYYVREYNPRPTDSPTESDEELKSSLRAALKTARRLEEVSQRMKSKLRRSYSENHLLF